MSEENEQIEDLEPVVTPEVIEGEIVNEEVVTGEPTETPEGEEGTHQSKSQGSKQRLKRKLRESEDRNLQLAEDAAASKTRMDALESKLESVINPLVRPNRVDFETEEDYEDSLFEFRDRSAKKPEPVQAVPQRPSAPALAQEVQENWDTQLDNGHEAHADFEQVIKNPNLNMTDPMAHAVMGSEHGSEIAYHLGKNPQEADRIAKLDMASQVREIDKLGSKFKPTTTNTPAPITPRGGSDTPMKDLKDLSMAEYAAARNKQQYG